MFITFPEGAEAQRRFFIMMRFKSDIRQDFISM